MATQNPAANPAQIAQEVRKRFLGEITRMMADVGGAVQEKLNSLINESVRMREAQTRRDAWDLYRRARGPWLDGTVKAWQQAMLPPTASAKLSLTADSFQLLGTDVVENKILVSRLVRGSQEKLTAQQDDLRIRLRVLEGHADFQDQDILRPESVILPMVENWAKSGMHRDSWPLVHDVIQTMLTDRLLAGFTAANMYLIENKVLPVIELKDRVKRVSNADPGQAPKPGFRSSMMQGQSDSTFGLDSTGGYTEGQGRARPRSGAGGLGQRDGARPSYYPEQQGYQGGHDGGYQGGHGGGYQGGHQAGYAGGHPGNPPSAYTGARGPAPQSAGPAHPGSGRSGPSPMSPAGGGQEERTAPGALGAHGSAAQQAGRSAAHYGGGEQGAYGGSHEETRMLTATTPLARARSRAQGVMGQLKRLLIGRIGPEAESTEYQPPSPRLAEAIAVRPRPDRGAEYGVGDTAIEEYSPAGVARVAGRLRQETNELKKKAETKNEKATIEVVALMFQAILQEERIPPGIRVWFARLQMPVLRLALEEPDFFGSVNHPARQLIDRMGSCVMGFDASGVQGSAMEAEVKRIVQVIEQYPETGKRVYQLMYDEFQKFLSKFLTEKGAAQKVASVAQQVEQKETLTIQYTIEMRNMLKDMPVPDGIREFLFKVWAEVLAVAAVRKGPQAAETLELKKCSSELVWASSAKPSRTDRAKVISELPKLLQRLRAGMTLLGLAPSVQDAHIKSVSDMMAQAFMSKTQAIPQEQIDDLANRLRNLEDFVSDDGMGDLPLDAESIEVMLGIDPATIDVIADGGSKPNNAMIAWANELQIGAWFMLDHNGRMTRVQFAWRSDRRHLNLFASTEGHTFLIQAGRLAAYLQAGLLLPQEEETLTVRATRDALAKLEANPERLLD